jgi:hypothetical protein
MGKFLPFLIFLSFLVCYLEWAGGHSGFIFQMEYQFFSGEISKGSLTHPLILFPLAGQIILLVAFFYPKRKLMLAAILMLSLLVVMILLAGILAMNVKQIISTLPFIGFSIYYFLNSRGKKTVRLDM